MNLLDLFVKIGVEDNASSKVESLSTKFKTGLASAGKIAAAGVGLVTAAAGAAGGALLALESATEEYRVAQGKLNTAFEAAGYSAETAKQAYSDFYGILGDTDTATEASQLLAKLALNAEDMSTWTRIAAGVNGTFGDSLPIEGLIESANETARVGQVTGTLADALNWASINEDDFNTRLAACTTEAERNQLIMNTLAGEYDTAADAFYKNNEAMIASRDAQAKMDESLSKLGESVSVVKTRLMGEMLPGLSAVAEGFAAMLSGTEGADQQFSTAVSNLVQTGVQKLPEFLNFGVQILTSVLNGVVQSIPALAAAVPQVVQSVAGAFRQLWPAVVSVGSELLEMATNGIIEYVPEMITRLPDVILGFLDFIDENLPTILEKGSEFLEEFAFGIIEAIPVLVAKLPEVINRMTKFFVDNYPKIIKTGGELLGKLLSGIIGTIPQIAIMLPEVIVAIVNALRSGWSELSNVGSYLLEGLWNGISDKITWLKNKVFGVVDTIKSWFTGSSGFDTHSPSKWSAGVMKNVMEGMSVGTDSGLPGALSTVRSAVSAVKSGMNFGTASVDFGSSGVGRMSAGIMNSLDSGEYRNYDGLSVNLVLPDGTKFASWQLPYLVKSAASNGTPIVNPQRG